MLSDRWWRCQSPSLRTSRARIKFLAKRALQGIQHALTPGIVISTASLGPRREFRATFASQWIYARSPSRRCLRSLHDNAMLRGFPSSRKDLKDKELHPAPVRGEIGPPHPCGRPPRPPVFVSGTETVTAVPLGQTGVTETRTLQRRQDSGHLSCHAAMVARTRQLESRALGRATVVASPAATGSRRASS